MCVWLNVVREEEEKKRMYQYPGSNENNCRSLDHAMSCQERREGRSDAKQRLSQYFLTYTLIQQSTVNTENDIAFFYSRKE